MKVVADELTRHRHWRVRHPEGLERPRTFETARAALDWRDRCADPRWIVEYVFRHRPELDKGHVVNVNDKTSMVCPTCGVLKPRCWCCGGPGGHDRYIRCAPCIERGKLGHRLHHVRVRFMRGHVGGLLVMWPRKTRHVGSTSPESDASTTPPPQHE